jgi:hypothetical protein
MIILALPSREVFVTSTVYFLKEELKKEFQQGMMGVEESQTSCLILEEFLEFSEPQFLGL